MDNNGEQQTNGSLVPPPMVPPEMLIAGGMPLVEMPVDTDGWPVQMVPMVQEAHEEPSIQQTELPPMDHDDQDEGEHEVIQDDDESQPMLPSPQPPSLMSLKVDSPDDGSKKPSELVLPKALEDVLALKTIRAQELGETVEGEPLGSGVYDPDGAIDSDDENGNEQSAAGDGGDDSSMHGAFSDHGLNRVEGKQEKNRRKKKRRKENKKARKEAMQKAHEQRLQQQQQHQHQQQQQHQSEKQQHKTAPSKHKSARIAKDAERAASEEKESDVEQEPTASEHDPARSADESDGGETEIVKELNGDGTADAEATETDGHHRKTNGQKVHQDQDREDTDEESPDQVESEEAPEKRVTAPKPGKKATATEESVLQDVEIEYVPEKVTIADLGPMYRQFYRVFEIFKLDTKSKEAAKGAEEAEREKAAAAEAKKLLDDGGGMGMGDDDDDDDDLGDGDGKDDREKISKRKLKKLNRLSVAELKQLVTRPDVVEMHDVTARDPKLLVQLKSHRNTVQVPRHWCFKRKYLQGKRGIEKPPFDLPAFIKKTGIMEMRASLQEKDEAKTLKAKMRERARPKMGKIDIDYQKLHDAFFKWQTKPRMTIHGDLYYEGKEFETRLKEKKPGDLSEELRIALGMPIGPACHKIPPPWLIAQQRYGPPPSYPNLKIPGLNAPIPEGCSFGYHAGGWGKPPVDESGKPLYGDVFGVAGMDGEGGMGEEEIDRTVWGELESESEESSEEEDEDEGEDLAGQPDESGLVTPAEGLVTPSGLTSGVPAGMETPDTIELRKKKIESEMEDNETPVLYHVLPEKRNERIGAAMMASTHVYDISAAGGGGGGGAGAGAGGAAAGAAAGGRGRVPVDREGTVELALDPSELDLDNEAMAQRYEQQMREQQSHLQKEDLSDMLAEHVARQKSKRKRQQTDTTSKQSKKYKEFKF